MELTEKQKQKLQNDKVENLILEQDWDHSQCKDLIIWLTELLSQMIDECDQTIEEMLLDQ